MRLPVVHDLRCSSCNAPVDLAASRLQTCRFCGAALVVKEMGPPKGTERVAHAVVLTQCGPSNAPRVAKLLVAQGVKAEQAEQLVRSAPCEVAVLEERDQAWTIQRALEAAGAQARLEERVQIVPAQVTVRVVLDDAGPDTVAVMRAVRTFVEHLGMSECKALVASAPCTVVDAIEEPKGRALCAALLSAGARARVL